MNRILRCEFDDRERAKKIFDEPKGPHWRGALGSARSKLRFGDHTEKNLVATSGEQLLEDVTILLQCVDAGVRVEQKH